jgi:hypothetical protein
VVVGDKVSSMEWVGHDLDRGPDQGGHGRESERSICKAHSSKLLSNTGERVRGFVGATEEVVGVSCSPNFIRSVENVGRDCIGD